MSTFLVPRPFQDNPIPHVFFQYKTPLQRIQCKSARLHLLTPFLIPSNQLKRETNKTKAYKLADPDSM